MSNVSFKLEGSEESGILQHQQKDFNNAACKGDLQTVQRLLKDGADVNDKDIDGRTPLHYAVSNGHADIVNILLKNGADVTLVTNKGNTPLHTACSKCYREIVEVLLQNISRDKLNDFVNAKTTGSGTTSLHVAAKCGSLEVVKSLLQHGATYNIDNKECKTPINLSKEQNVIDLLILVDELFEGTKKGNAEIINKLRVVKADEFLAATRTSDNQGNTLLQVAIVNGHKNIVGELLEMLNESHQVESLSSPKFELDQLERLTRTAENQISRSKLYLPILKSYSRPGNNTVPWRAVKEGSYYLANLYNLLEVYKDCVPGSIENKDIQTVNDIMVALEFDPKHITSGYTDEAYGGQTKCFVSKGQGTKYYELLHSEFTKDVRTFIEIIELFIDIPVQRFLGPIKHRLQLAYSEKLLEAIENGNLSVVEQCLKGGVDVNFKGTEGRTPLHYAVNNGNIDIVSTLLKNGADVTLVTNEGYTPLHTASSKGYREVVEVLSQYMSRDEFHNLINAKINGNATTPLHVAAKCGSLEVVKSLLQHGATYNIEDKEGKTPINLSKEQNVTNLLELVDELFEDAKKGNAEITNKLRVVKTDEFLAVTKTHDNQGNTLLQVAIVNGHKNIVGELLEMLNESHQVESLSSPKFELDQLERLTWAAENQIRFSQVYLPILKSLSGPYGPENNPFPWSAVKEGSYYLGNVYKLLKVYKDCVPGSIENKYIQTVNDIMVALEFDPKHMTTGYTYEASGGQGKCFVSKGQGTKYYELLHSEFTKDVRTFIEIIELFIDIPVQRFLGPIKHRLQLAYSEKLLEAIENGNLSVVEQCLKGGVDVNFKGTEGRTPLHYAVNNGNIDIVSTLLKNGADVTLVTNEGYTPLHTASSKGYREVVEVLSQYMSRDEFHNLINAKINGNATTPLHVAAKCGSLEVVKSLLQHGASYNIEDKEGKTPINLSKEQNVTNLLELVDELFEDAKKGNAEITNKLRVVKTDEFLAVTKTHDNQGNTLLQVAIVNGHKNIVGELLEMPNESHQVESLSSPKFELDQLERLTWAAENQIRFSQVYLPILKSLSGPYGPENNPFPWSAVKEGSYYLGNIYYLLKVYKDCVPGSIENKYIQTVNDIMVALEFDPKHMTTGYTDEASGGQGKCFVSKGQGTKYYELLHSEFKKDVRTFIEMVELFIDIPVQRFLGPIKHRLRLAYSEKLLEAIENGNLSVVEQCIKGEVDVNFKDTEGRTPLHYAVSNGNIDIVSTLLKNGADVTLVTNEGYTPLHTASSKGYREVVEVLSQYMSRDEFHNLINAKINGNATTPLHVAAKCGSLEVVKSLLQHGATYNNEDKEGKTPINLSKEQNVNNLLELVDELFEDAKKGNAEIINKLRVVKTDEFLVVTRTRDNQGNTLLQVAIVNGHKNIARKLLEML